MTRKYRAHWKGEPDQLLRVEAGNRPQAAAKFARIADKDQTMIVGKLVALERLVMVSGEPGAPFKAYRVMAHVSYRATADR